MSNTSDAPATVKVWDLPLRLFHWLLVAAIAVAFLSAEGDGPLAPWHMAAGWVAAVLLGFRVVWGVVGSEHARFSDFIRLRGMATHFRGLLSGRPKVSLGHNPAGALAVLALITLIAATLWTGIAGREDLHEGIAWVLLGMVGIHVAAVLANSLLTRENLARAMVTGRKQRALHPAARDYRPASFAGFLLALAAIAGSAWAALAVDPSAFSPQQGERAEGGEGAETVETVAHSAEVRRAEDGDGD